MTRPLSVRKQWLPGFENASLVSIGNLNHLHPLLSCFVILGGQLGTFHRLRFDFLHTPHEAVVHVKVVIVFLIEKLVFFVWLARWW